MIRLRLEDFKIALRDLSPVFKSISIVMLSPIIATLYYGVYKTGDYDFFRMMQLASAFIIPAVLLYLLYLATKRVSNRHITKTKQSMIAVVLVWMIIALVGALPFYLRGTLNGVDSFFESMSGWATTGMTMIEYPEDLMNGNEDMLIYRSVTHLVGGVGIIALALIVLIQSGSVAMAYYSSEVGAQKIKPGIRSTLIETWKIYLVYAIAGIVMLYLAGMTFFDSINHSFAAIATGGFSTHSESIAYYDSPLIEAVLIVLMLAGSISFLLHYRIFEGKAKVFINNIETKLMFILLVSSTVLVSIYFIFNSYIVGVDTTSLFDVVRKSVFQVISAASCTGFSTVNAGEWPPFAQTILMVLMYTGGFYGSTAGGIKLIRLAAVAAAVTHTVKKLVLPKSAMVTLKISGKTIKDKEVVYALALCMIYLAICIVGAMVIMALGYDPYDSLSVTLSAMGNVGIVYISGSPWFDMPVVGKITLTLLMWIGRLEIFPLIIVVKELLNIKNFKG